MTGPSRPRPPSFTIKMVPASPPIPAAASMKPNPRAPTSSRSSAKIGNNTTYEVPKIEVKNESPIVAKKSGRERM